MSIKSRNFYTSLLRSSSNDKKDILAQAALAILSNESINDLKCIKFNIDGEEQKVSIKSNSDGFDIQVNDGAWENVQMTKLEENGNISLEMKINAHSSKVTVTSDKVTIISGEGKTEMKLDKRNSDYFNASIASSSNRTLYYLAAFILAIQWIVFIHAGGFFGNERTEKYYDLTGSLTYLSTIALSLFLTKNIAMRQLILSTFVAIWASRLGWFLYSRIHNNNGIDSRFEEMKKDNLKFWAAWTIQALWIFLCLFPVLKLAQTRVLRRLSALDFVGFGIWGFGFALECIADYQKRAFRAVAENKGKFIDSGLWSISRHPNYFGEILLWTGISLSAFSGTRSPLVFISPIFVSFLLICISGIPLLEKSADEKYGSDQRYLDYKENTPVLVPFIGRKGDASF